MDAIHDRTGRTRAAVSQVSGFTVIVRARSFHHTVQSLEAAQPSPDRLILFLVIFLESTLPGRLSTIKILGM
jgi:hypothetical protein